jgi:hypothetical protein
MKQSPLIHGQINKMGVEIEYFVHKNSVVRTIWGRSDTILFIFAGASAEFALNKAVDWLYFTGKLPADPLGRLFSTVTYARQIVFSELHEANAAIDRITAIHAAVENNRQAKIPDWAYRDVLFMLIHYSIAAFELLQRKLNDEEKEEMYRVFLAIGQRMHLKDLPADHKTWLTVRREHLDADLQKSHYTVDLYKQYRKHLGSFRYWLLLESQKLVVPGIVKEMLGLSRIQWVRPVIPFYKFSRKIKFDSTIRAIILPKKYKSEIKAMDFKEEN